jgi:hypothetical protein
MDKLGYMLETPQVSWWYSARVGIPMTPASDNPRVTRTISREVLSDLVSQPDPMTPQRLHADSRITRGVIQAYCQGALHDGTFNRRHRTHRITQKGTDWLGRLGYLLYLLGHASWIYREGKIRNEVYVIETTANFLDVNFDPCLLNSQDEKVAYVRGYFDADGGMPRRPDATPFQIQYTQKDRTELMIVRDILVGLGIRCGKLHNPSKKIDADYWRFFISIPCNKDFARHIGSWHPRKELLLGMMI